jgi:hypothetical protein
MAHSYNRSLDFLVSAAVKLAQGKPELSAKCLLKATRDPSFAQCIKMLEASNQKAFEVAASVAAERRKVTAAEEAEDAELEGLVGDLDALDDEADETEVDAAEQAPNAHPSVDEGVPTDMLEKQSRGGDPVAARFARALTGKK